MFNFFKKKYNIVVIGSNGMLGSEIYTQLMLEAEEKTFINSVIGLDINNINIADYYDAKYCIENLNIKPDYIINCAAYTDTNACQDNSDGTLTSYRANVLGAKNLADICLELNIKLIHISTDYVSSQYRTSQTFEFPINTYGLHKLLAEKYIELCFKHKPKSYMIIRTSWLYGPNSNNKTFIHKFIKNCHNALSTGTNTVYVTDECFGRPTSTIYLSSFISKAIQLKMYGIMDGQQESLSTSRYDWANYILIYLSSKYPEYSVLKIEKYINNTDTKNTCIVQHPTCALGIKQFGNSLNDYHLASRYTGTLSISKSSQYINKMYANYMNSWKYHTKVFLEQNLDDIILWVKNN